MTGCPAGTVIGELPAGFDRGSTTVATGQITDFMTIPFSVTRRAVVRAQAGNFSDFFYVRRFTSVNNADIGNGAGVDRFEFVTCRLTAGISRSPLSLTRVELYGDEPGEERIDQVRIDAGNVETGVVKAFIQYTGTGLLTGWWEVRTPGDPPVRELDRFTEASLPENQRAQQQRFRRVKRFRVQVPLTGRITLEGPSYAQLPRETPGLYEVLLRVEVSKDREALSGLGNTGGSDRLISGGAAGFPLETLEYRVGAAITGAAQTPLSPRVVIEDALEEGEKQVAVVWTPLEGAGEIIRVDVTNPATGEVNKIIAPMSKGYVVLPRGWTDGETIEDLQYAVTPLGANRQPSAETQHIRVAE